MTLSTVGGWLACRGAGQLSTRYGKIEDIVVGLDVVLADGRTIHTGGHPRQAAGPDLNQLFVGSEGTLGIITGARLRAHPAPDPRASGGVRLRQSFAAGLEACRRILRRGATPAVLRLYDAIEADRNYGTGDRPQRRCSCSTRATPPWSTATWQVVDRGVRRRPSGSTTALVEHWLGHRNDVAALEALISRRPTWSTPWRSPGRGPTLPGVYRRHPATPSPPCAGTLAVSAHQSPQLPRRRAASTSPSRASPEPTRGQGRLLPRRVGRRHPGRAGRGRLAVSHHHGVGLNRARFMAEALGDGLDVLVAVKDALDPNGILNPGKLGLGSPWGTPTVP